MEHLTAETFDQNAREAMLDPVLHGALRNLADNFAERRKVAMSTVDDWEGLRERARTILASLGRNPSYATGQRGTASARGRLATRSRFLATLGPAIQRATHSRISARTPQDAPRPACRYLDLTGDLGGPRRCQPHVALLPVQGHGDSLGVCLLRLSPLDRDGRSRLRFPRISLLAALPSGAKGWSQARGYGCRYDRWPRFTSSG